ncbi:MAG: 50S ribosomal protein L17 [Candidatus Nomurabacteria bacterium]|nr:50S ribosomal protein L17 [Candidatus Nomurabacteria bacterium]USN87923.1 MAG: 50S ribosomal protein L17 [Candidatus Nomurabacteria bacterium]
MRHANKNRKLGRNTDQRTALLRGLSVSLIRDGKITTTLAKAKELQPRIERLVTHAKKGTVTARRTVSTRLGEPSDVIIKKLFLDIAPKFSERNGGYTRVIKIGRMPSGREEAVIEFVE